MDEDATDRALIEAVAKGDRAALEQLFTRHNARVFRLLQRIVGRREIAEDLLNEVFLKVWRHANRYEGRSSPMTWLLTIAHNEAIDALRKQREVTGLEDRVAAQLVDTDDTPDETAQKRDKSRLIRACIARLSPEHRTIIDLFYYHERSISEVSEILSIPANTVKTRMFYARKKLAELLRECGVDRDWP